MLCAVTADELLGDAHLSFCVIAMALDQEKNALAVSFFHSLTEITANIAKIHSSSSTNSY